MTSLLRSSWNKNKLWLVRISVSLFECLNFILRTEMLPGNPLGHAQQFYIGPCQKCREMWPLPGRKSTVLERSLCDSTVQLWHFPTVAIAVCTYDPRAKPRSRSQHKGIGRNTERWAYPNKDWQKTLGQKDTKTVFRLKRDSCSHPSSLVEELCMFTSLTMLVISVLIETHEKTTCSVAYLRLSHSCFQKTHNFCPGKLSINVNQIYQMLQPIVLRRIFSKLASVWPVITQYTPKSSTSYRSWKVAFPERKDRNKTMFFSKFLLLVIFPASFCFFSYKLKARWGFKRW